METPTTLLEAVRYFSDLDVCHQYMLVIRWPDGAITCPRCDSKNVGNIASRRLIQCKDCRKQTSAKVGTIFEDSKLQLDRWFVAVWAIANCKNGISSLELSRALGITQKSAWFMLHRIRLAMRTNSFRKLSGEIESDETFIGGAAANMHKHVREKKIKGRGASGKVIVQGILERGGEVRAEVVPNTDAATLQPVIRQNVQKGASLFTDAHQSYRGMADRYLHEWIDHATAYVRGRVHVNGLENFWALLKRSIKGTYVAVSPFHLFRYVDEQAWRYNNRKTDDGDRFIEVMRGVIGKRLTFRRLCAIGDSGFMGID